MTLSSQAHGSTEVVRQSSAPTDTSLWWVDSSSTPEILKVHNGTSWIVVGTENYVSGSIQVGDLAFDPATQTELNNHAGDSDAHHTKTPKALTKLGLSREDHLYTLTGQGTATANRTSNGYFEDPDEFELNSDPGNDDAYAQWDPMPRFAYLNSWRVYLRVANYTDNGYVYGSASLESVNNNYIFYARIKPSDNPAITLNGVGSISSVSLNTNYKFEARNIDWNAGTADCYINDTFEGQITLNGEYQFPSWVSFNSDTNVSAEFMDLYAGSMYMEDL